LWTDGKNLVDLIRWLVQMRRRLHAKIFRRSILSPMAQPNLTPSKPKKKKIPKKPSQKQLAKEKYKKRLDEFKVVFLMI
jgi:hypothetical protein